jgi:hypothetical protein
MTLKQLSNQHPKIKLIKFKACSVFPLGFHDQSCLQKHDIRVAQWDAADNQVPIVIFHNGIKLYFQQMLF